VCGGAADLEFLMGGKTSFVAIRSLSHGARGSHLSPEKGTFWAEHGFGY